MSDPIEHVVVLMLENSSFDRILGALPGVDGVVPGQPRTNPDFPSGAPITQAQTTERRMQLDPEHELDDVLRQIQGPCLGFVSDFAQHYPQSTAADRAEIMGWYPLGFLPAMHALAGAFVVCDRWFCSLPGPTWSNRFFVHTGTSLGRVKMPGGIFHPNLHCYDQTTVYDRLSEKNISWEIYYGDIPQSIVLTHQWEHPTHYHRMDDFYAAAAGAADHFPAYCFLEPTYFGAMQNDQHPPSDVLRGDLLVAQVYNALRANDALWSKTLFVLLSDEHGGFFDHVPPPAAIPPDEHTEEYSFDQYGPRVPAILISPWLPHRVISDVFDHTSLLKYVTDKWGLGPLGARVAQAASFGKYLTELKTPRTDTPASLPLPAALDNPQVQDMNLNQRSLVGFGRFLETKITTLSEQLGTDARTVFQGVGQRLVNSMTAAGSHAEVAAERVECFLHLRKAAAG